MFFKLIITILCVIYLKIGNAINLNITKCQSSGYDKWITVDNKTCYIVMNYTQMTWHEASQYCLQIGGRLPSIHSKLSNDLMVNLTRKLIAHDNNYDFLIWIGLNSLDMRGFYKWSDGTPIEYRNFPTNGTVNLDINLMGRCVYLNNTIRNNQSNGFWYYGNCNQYHTYVCEKNFSLTVIPPTTPKPPGNCPSDWLQYADEKCIKIIDDKLMTWTEAKTRCNSMRGELLSIHSVEEQNYITSLIPNITAPYIGLSLQNDIGWYWDDQSPFTFSNWAMVSTGYMYKCIALITSEVQTGRWLTTNCSSTHPAICERPKDPSNTTPHNRTYPICKIPGFSNFVQYRNSCYLMVDKLEDQKTWNDAETACNRFNGSHLASIVDPFEYAFLIYYLQQYSNPIQDQFWIGFSADGSVSNSTFKWTDNWPNYFTVWDQNEPQFSGKAVKECVYQLRKNGTWRTSDCLTKKSYICKTTLNKIPNLNQNLNGSCPKLNTTNTKLFWTDLDQRSKYCYWFSHSMESDEGVVSWPDAAFQCKQRNSTLASIHSTHDLLLMKNMISNTYYNTWIGLSQTSTGRFVWEDKSAVDFTNWDQNPDTEADYLPTVASIFSEKCVEVKSVDLKWVRIRCSNIRRNFVCQTPKIYKTVSPFLIVNVSSTTTSSPTNSTSEAPSDKLSTGSVAGIVMAVVIGVVIVGVIGYYIYKNLKCNTPDIPSFENELYASKRAQNGRPNGANVKSEPVVTFTKKDKESPSNTPTPPKRSNSRSKN